MPAFRAPRGTRDLLPTETTTWSRLERLAAELAVRYGYRRIETPMFEQTTVFEGGRITLSTADVEGGLRIYVADTGCGIADDVREHIFLPFYTTKPAGTGTGLGLPTSRRIVEAHGGTLELHATGPGGSVFRIEMPRRGSRAAWQARARMARGVLNERYGAAGGIESAG